MSLVLIKKEKSTCDRISFLIKLQACNFILKKLWQRCFPVNLVKCLRKPFLTEHAVSEFLRYVLVVPLA